MARRIGPTFELAASERVLRLYERALAESPAKARKGGLRALRKTLRSSRAAASTEIRKTINLKKKVVDQRIRTRVISERSLVGSMAVRDRRIELVEFMTPTQIATAYRRQRARRSAGVPVKTHKQKGRQVFTGTFLAQGRVDGKWHVLKRQGPDQYPIFIQYGPNMIEDFEKGFPAFVERQNAVAQKNMEHELLFVLGEV